MISSKLLVKPILSKKSDPYDQLGHSIRDIAARVRPLTVEDKATASIAVSLGTQIQDLKREIKEIRKIYIEEPKRIVALINQTARTYETSLDALSRQVKTKIANYQIREELARRQAQKDAIDRLGQNGLDKLPASPAPPLRTSEGVAYTKSGWKWEVGDMHIIPREYLIPNSAKIRAAIKGGVRQIKGIKIYETKDIVIKGR